MVTPPQKAPKGKGILFIDRQKIYLYSQQQNMLWSMDLVPQIVLDMEIVDKDGLKKFVTWFISTNKIAPLHALTVVAEGLLFRKQFAPKTPNEEEAVKAFIQAVPFEHVAHKVYGKQEEAHEVVAVNADFIESIRMIFEEHGFSFDGVLPTTFLGELSMSKVAPTIGSAQATLKRIESLKGYVISTQDAQVPGKQAFVEVEESEAQQNPKSYLPYLIIFFGVLVSILLYLILRPQPAAQSKKSSRPEPTSAVKKPPPVAAAPASSLAKGEITILITSAQASQQQAETLRDRLQEAGFSTIEIQTKEGLGSTTTSITFLPAVAQSERASIQGAVAEVFSSPTVRQSQSASHAVIITPETSQ